MKFTSLAALVACVPALVKAAGTGNPYTGATVFPIPEYQDEVKAAVAKYGPLSSKLSEFLTTF